MIGTEDATNQLKSKISKQEESKPADIKEQNKYKEKVTFCQSEEENKTYNIIQMYAQMDSVDRIVFGCNYFNTLILLSIHRPVLIPMEKHVR